MAKQFFKFNKKINRRFPQDEGDYDEPLVRENLPSRNGRLQNVEGTEIDISMLPSIPTWMARYHTLETGIISPKTFAYTQDGKLHLLDYLKEDIYGIVTDVYPQVNLDMMEYATDGAAEAAYVTDGGYGNTGGIITTDGLYKVHTFNSGGTFTPIKSGSVDVLIVGGGGGGGSSSGNGQGGGGAGGYRELAGVAITAQAYTVVVGDGGASNNNGIASSALGYSAAGGGKGGSGAVGSDGGSGGGGGATLAGGAGNTPSTTPSQGNDGGDSATGITLIGGGGGGGADTAGSDSLSDPAVGGNGGDGIASSISGSSVTRGGGGGGGANTGTAGTATGGGGDGNAGGAGEAGTANTGGGGGGAGGASAAGGAGGSGVVIIRCLASDFVSLQSYSEASIKTQGSYSLKGIADITTSLNKTLTYTPAVAIDLSNLVTIKFDIYASRTGANIKIGIHDSGGTTTEKTYTVLAANIWETVTWDISTIANADKNAIDSIVITILNAASANTFYIDNFYGEARTVVTNALQGFKFTFSPGDFATIKENLNANAYPNSWLFKTTNQVTMYFVDGLDMYSYDGNNDNRFEKVNLVDSTGASVKPIDLIEHRDRNCAISETSLFISANLEPSVFDSATDSIEIIIGSGQGKNLAIRKINEYLYILNTEGIFVLYGDTISALAVTFEVKLIDAHRICAFRSAQTVERSIIFLAAYDKTLELWSFDGTSCKLLSYLEMLTDDINPAPEMLQKACSCYYNNYYMLSVVANGATTPNLEFWYDTLEDKIEFIKGRNVSCYMATDPTVEQCYQLLGRGDIGKIMWANRGRNFDGVGIVKRLRSKDITISEGDNVRFTAFYPGIDPTGKRNMFFRYLLDGRLSEISGTENFLLDLSGENKSLGFINFSNQNQYTDRVQPKINYARGTSIAIEILDSTIDMEFQMCNFGIEYLGKGKKKGKKVGQ